MQMAFQKNKHYKVDGRGERERINAFRNEV